MSDGGCVRLEIPAARLGELIASGAVCVADLRCLDGESKAFVWHLLLQSITGAFRLSVAPAVPAGAAPPMHPDPDASNGHRPGKARCERVRLSEVREGDRVRLVDAEGGDAQRWLLLAGFIEDLPARILKRASNGRMVLAIDGRTVLIPSRIARAAVVHRCCP